MEKKIQALWIYMGHFDAAQESISNEVPITGNNSCKLLSLPYLLHNLSKQKNSNVS